ncbi:MAG: hypothetical protein A3C13_02285 [Candidatus Lloydbacteria bacterium RIFCSPHIGHO2_02_FULL_50_11]|nr:MAG: hypothetical protein A3C13_02285 [Candidatus Lloydbacteria bacterium RIFCSPHIGHO2_02_FULL_50_11]
MATIEDFKNIEMKIGTILVAEYIEGADKLLRLEVDFGPKEKRSDMEAEAAIEGERDIRQILSGIREYYSPEQLIGEQCPFVTNLEPRTLRGLVSNGMILAVKSPDGGAILLHPERPTEAGSMLS